MSDSPQVTHTDQPLSHTDPASSSSPIHDIWGCMSGKIFVLHSTWNPKRVIDRTTHELKTYNPSLAKILLDKKVTDEEIKAMVNGITRYDNFLIEGDMIALDHILSTLRFLYDPNDIFKVNSWILGSNIEKVQKNELFVNDIVNSNVVLLCGPLGNLATSLFLEKAGLSWLFDPQDKHMIRTHPNLEKAKPLKVEVSEEKQGSFNKLHNDYGFFLRCKNPYNQQKYMYALMGTYSYGTQGAAAFACNADSLADLYQVPIDSEIKGLDVDYIAWIKISREGETALGEFSDPKLTYEIFWPKLPGKKWKSYTNPNHNHKTQNTLRIDLLENTLFLGTRPIKLLLYSLVLSIAVFLSSMLLLTKHRKSTIFAMLFFTGIITVKAFISVLMPPVQGRNK